MFILPVVTNSSSSNYIAARLTVASKSQCHEPKGEATYSACSLQPAWCTASQGLQSTQTAAISKQTDNNRQ